MSADAPFSFLPLGATLQTFFVGPHNIVLSFPTQADYAAHNSSFFGESIGRVANRIRNARIDSLAGQPRTLHSANDGSHTLHGGEAGWGKRIWAGPTPIGIVDLAQWEQPAAAAAPASGLREPQQPPLLEGVQGGESVRFVLRSDDGDEGFPGAVEVRATFTAASQIIESEHVPAGNDTEASREKKLRQITVLGIEYEAEIVDDTPETVVNMTNHSCFNLCPSRPTIEGTRLALCSTTHLPLDAASLPTGAPPAAYPGVSPDLPFELGAAEPDIDSLFLVDGAAADPRGYTVDSRARPLVRVASASHPESGVHLEVLTTEPAFQVYAGRYIDVSAVEGAPARGKRAGFCIEPCRYINAANIPEYRDMVLLRKGDKYGCRIVYRAWEE